MVKNYSRNLYLWVLLGILIGTGIGALFPHAGSQLKPVGDAFISLIKMLIGPIVFCTVVEGMAGARDLKQLGRIGGKSLLYFEVVSTFALGIGILVANVLQPGAGVHATASEFLGHELPQLSRHSLPQHLSDYFLNLIPKSFFEPLVASGDLLQVLLIAILFGYALNHLGEQVDIIRSGIRATSHIFSKMLHLISRLAPLGAGCAMAYTVGTFGIHSLVNLVYLMSCFYLTCILFVLLVLGLIARWTGFSIFRFLNYIKEEILLVLGTSSSETALIPLMEKLEKLGCPRSVVGVVVTSGYSFNLDGTNIYLTLASLFIAQALGIHLSWVEQIQLLGVAMITSKGASGVTGAGFIVLAATLAAVPSIPPESLALVLGVDRFMSEARSITNLIGNGVAALVIAAWEGTLDRACLKRGLS